MAALSGNQLAYMTARFGAFRFGSARFGFKPAQTEGATAGSSGGYYQWRRVYPTSSSWSQLDDGA